MIIEDDPIVERKIGKKFLQMRESHKLPIYLNEFPFYDRALPRICKEINTVDGYLKVVDVGANIGDTVSLITDEVQGSFLCVEGDAEYLPLLKINTGRVRKSEIFIEEAYCSENSSYTCRQYEINRVDGTAFLSLAKENKSQADTKFKALDDIIKKQSVFKDSNLLKIDTDGFEINVLTGGEEFLKDAKPTIYFEFFPEFYLNNNQDPMFIFELLNKNGYAEALFYDNFGLPMEIVYTSDQKRISELINLIDKNKIFYYDILTCHSSKWEKYKEIFYGELNLIN